jgi:hypothetical protein
MSNADKLAQLVASEGYHALDDLLEACITDSVCMGICCNPGCDYTTEVEPDQTEGYCEVCGTGTVKSAMVLAGIV